MGERRARKGRYTTEEFVVKARGSDAPPRGHMEPGDSRGEPEPASSVSKPLFPGCIPGTQELARRPGSWTLESERSKFKSGSKPTSWVTLGK